MSFIPDELWRRIFEGGIESSSISYKDLCCISITCRRFHRLSSEDPLWNLLLSLDFDPLDFSPFTPSPPPSPKSLYKSRFERVKERKIAAHRRALLRKESQIAEHSRRLRDIETRVARETAKARETATELSNLCRIRQANVALNVWQPEVVRDRQKQMVEQSVVPAESRIHALENEFRLCKQQLMSLDKSYKYEKLRLETAKAELVAMKYHPLREHKPVSGGENEHKIKAKKLKSCNGLQEKQFKTP